MRLVVVIVRHRKGGVVDGDYRLPASSSATRGWVVQLLIVGSSTGLGEVTDASAGTGRNVGRGWFRDGRSRSGRWRRRCGHDRRWFLNLRSTGALPLNQCIERDGGLVVSRLVLSKDDVTRCEHLPGLWIVVVIDMLGTPQRIS